MIPRNAIIYKQDPTDPTAPNIRMTEEETAQFWAEQDAQEAKFADIMQIKVPRSISDRQFFQQLAIDGVISEDEALASNSGVIPPQMLAIIESMPADQKFSAKMVVSGATVYERNNAMTIAIGAAYGWTSEQIDDLFRAAVKL